MCRCITICLLLAVGGGVPAVQAQVERSGGGANAQLMQQYQQALSEVTSLKADNARQKKDLDDMKAQLDAAKRQLEAAKAGAGQVQAALTAAQASDQSNVQALDQTRKRLQELVDRYRDTVASLRGLETDHTQLQQQLAQSKSEFDQCAERNYQLYEVDGEVLDRYEHQGVFAHLAKAEPFTQLKRTQIENLVDEYRARAEELRVHKAAGSPTAAASPAPKN
jgi:chromosome segregation ATPase